MSSSMLARGLMITLALVVLAAPAAVAEDPETTETTTTTTETERAPDPWAETPETVRLLARAVRFKAVTRRWRTLMGKPMARIAPPAVVFETLLEQRRWWMRAWRHKADRARRRGHRPPHLQAWRCIHSHEGSWTDPGAPYYGGLQMDITFQRQYGGRLLRRKGTANYWTRFEQMWVAERAHRSGRGFHPWPNTARYCGLM